MALQCDLNTFLLTKLDREFVVIHCGDKVIKTL